MKALSFYAEDGYDGLGYVSLILLLGLFALQPGEHEGLQFPQMFVLLLV